MLKTRIITALMLVAVFIPALFTLSNTYWAYSMLALALLALNEWAGMVQLLVKERVIYLAVAAMAGFAALQMLVQQGFHWFFFQSLGIFFVVALFWTLMVPLWLARKWIVNKYALALLGFLLMASVWTALVCAKGADPRLLLALLATIWIADSAAYFAGKQFGRHKLAPSISPGKTWEGVLGAQIAVTVYGIILYFTFDINSFAIFPALWLITSLGVIGDLFESMLKRQANMKDSGQILPGHGGILDRIDGIIPSLPIAILAIYAYNLWW
jgi:phosphatidate cytidylyltransferase